MIYALCFLGGIAATLLALWGCNKLIAWQERENDRKAIQSLYDDTLNHLFEKE